MPVSIKKCTKAKGSITESLATGPLSGGPVTPVIHADKVLMIPIKNLIPYAKNSRTHSKGQIKQLANSIMEWGWTIPVLVDEGGGVIAGHGRILAASQLGMSEVPTITASGWSDAQKRAYILADNQLALNAGWDTTLLAGELDFLVTSGFDASLTGFKASDLVGLGIGVGGLTDEGSVPLMYNTPPVSKVGDVWLLGDHRVMCGSSISLKDMEILMQGTRANLVWTDPPYLMNYQGALDEKGNKKSGGHKAIINDNLSKKEGEEFLLKVAQQVKYWCSGSWYITFYRLGLDWMFEALKGAGLKYRNVIIWRKNNMNLSNSDYKSMYEPMITGWADDYQPIFYGWTDGHYWHGTKGECDVWEVNIPSIWDIDKTKKNTLHPTMKPVELVERSILNSSLPGEIVLDLFGGSGTTLIASAKTGRVSRLMELDPSYVDVIVRRWMEYTGGVAVLESTGEAFPSEKD